VVTYTYRGLACRDLNLCADVEEMVRCEAIKGLLDFDAFTEED
jgi:hypothetical protein